MINGKKEKVILMDNLMGQKDIQFLNTIKILAANNKCIINKIDIEKKILDISGDEEDKKRFLNKLTELFKEKKNGKT